MPKFLQVRQNLPGRLSFGGWITVAVVLIAHAIPSSHGCLRLAGRVARKPLQSGVEVVENVVQIPRRTKSLPNIKPKDPHVNPLDRIPAMR